MAFITNSPCPDSQDLIVRSHPQEEELAAARAKLAFLTEHLAERELEQAEIRRELGLFQQLYYRTMGSRYVELDELRARIAEKRFARAPEKDWLAGRARRRREEADRSARDYQAWESAPGPPPKPPVPPSENARQLYRRIAAAIHPDRAESDASRTVRTKLMADLNAAYAEGDIRRMESILEAWKRSPESVEGDGPSAELARLERTIEKVSRKIARVEEETTRLSSAPLYKLMVRVSEAKAQGRDLLAELAAEIDHKIVEARQELAEI